MTIAFLTSKEEYMKQKWCLSESENLILKDAKFGFSGNLF